jgi:hypothetical protein
MSAMVMPFVQVPLLYWPQLVVIVTAIGHFFIVFALCLWLMA